MAVRRGNMKAIDKNYDGHGYNPLRYANMLVY